METGTTTDGVNLRSAPNKDTTTKILRLLTKGTPLTILDHDSNPWLHVQTSDNIVGFVHGDYVTIQAAQPTTKPAKKTAAATQTSSGQGASSPPAAPTTAPADLSKFDSYVESLMDEFPIPQGYYDFQAQATKLGLPAPFDAPPTLLADPSKLQLNGFGPNQFALNNWSNWYTRVCGMHNGLDHNIATGTPLLALSDAVVVGDRTTWPFMASRYEKTLVIWCLLPESVTDADGNRMLSNVIVAYGHMSNNTVVKKGQMVKAGQIIGYSGYPHNEDADTGRMIEQPGNAHLHMEVHLLSGDNNTPYSRGRKPGLLRAFNRPQPFDNNTPWNPMLFFSERLIKYQMHQSVAVGRVYPDAGVLGRVAPPVRNWPPLDFFSIAYFQYPGVRYANIIWKATNPPPWGKGVYGLDDALQRIQSFPNFEPYPIPKSM